MRRLQSIEICSELYYSLRILSVIFRPCGLSIFLMLGKHIFFLSNKPRHLHGSNLMFLKVIKRQTLGMQKTSRGVQLRAFAEPVTVSNSRGET